MNHKITNHWDESKLGNGFYFCIQRFDELLFDYTLDSYKPRALNAPSLCIELINVIDEVEKGVVDSNNISHILEELRSNFKRDKVAKALISTSLDYFLGFKEGSSIKELGLRISVLERSLERNRYIREIQKELCSAIKNNNKNDIDTLISNYVTTLINRGISKQFIYKKFNKIFFNNNNPISSEDSLEEFFSQMHPKRHGYSVYFKVSKNILLLEKSFSYFGIKSIDDKDEESKKLFEDHKFQTKNNDIIIEISKLRLPDPYFARDHAEKRLETLRNTSHLFLHNSKLRWNKTALVKQLCCDKESLIARNQINPMRKSFNYKSNEVATLTNTVFQSISLQRESFIKFNRVLELHSNCLQNLTPENQLVNLWIILETLIPSTNKRSKVSNICNQITPILLLRYFRKLVLNLYEDIVRWDSNALEPILVNVKCDLNTSFSKFTLLLSSEEYKNNLDELYKMFGDFHLLRNRVYKISNLLRDKSKIIERLDNHKKNIIWQVRRVYRTRNLIVHSGSSPRYINVLIENTHDYVDQLLSEIIEMTTSTYKIYNLEQAFEFGNILNNKLEKTLKESKFPNEYIFDLLREKPI